MTGSSLAMTLNANFLANQSEGTLRAVSTFVKRGRSVTVVRTIVYGASDKIVADVTTTHVPAR